MRRVRRDGPSRPEQEELRPLRRENGQLRIEREILANSLGPVRSRGRVGVLPVYEFMRTHQADIRYSTMCRVLKVSPSGRYAWFETPAVGSRSGGCRAQGARRADSPTLPGHLGGAEDPGRTGRGGAQRQSQAHRPIDARTWGCVGYAAAAASPRPVAAGSAGSPPTWSTGCFRPPAGIVCGWRASPAFPRDRVCCI